MNEDAQVQGNDEYQYRSPDPSHISAYLQQLVIRLARSHAAADAEVLDAGCGNGWFSKHLFDAGFAVSAIDSSRSGIEQASDIRRGIDFRVGSLYDDLTAIFGKNFDVVVSLEVIEHLFDPRLFVKRVYDSMAPNGIFIVSTPYHGYLKNLVLALSGRLDAHFTALWDGGHIKFWSRRTLSALLAQAGFQVIDFVGAGRFSFLWKSMVLVARKGPIPRSPQDLSQTLR